jgi:hypothetical protein
MTGTMPDLLKILDKPPKYIKKKGYQNQGCKGKTKNLNVRAKK